MCNSSVKSEESTLIEADIDQLNSISPFFKIDETKYGGRGCFSYSTIPKNTIIATCLHPLSSTILKEFRKEVCNQCFDYFEGKTLKYKLSGPNTNSNNNYSIYFCSQECLQVFQSEDVDNLYLNTLISVEENFNKGLKKPEQELKEPLKSIDLVHQIRQQWNEVNQWEDKVGKMKVTKRQQLIPRLSDSEYVDTKYIFGVLFQLYKYQSFKLSNQNNKFLSDYNANEYTKFEIDAFESLQSNELDKVSKYPYLLYSYVNIYKFIKLTADPLLQPFITSDSIRNIIGRHLSNAFGIWSNVTDEQREDKEYFGFAVYPTASFFNHSCAPNIIKKRIKNKLTFTTLKDIEQGEELCINYGYSTEDKVEVRQSDLKEWFFDCSCVRCVKESTSH